MLRALLVASLAAACAHATPDREVRAQAYQAYERKEFAACGAPLEHAGEWYDAACCRALAGSADAAFADLERATAGVYRMVEHLKTDPDLASLHADPRWQKLVASAEARLTEYRKAINPELLQLFTDDQADRSAGRDHIDWSVVNVRDAAREKRVAEILAQGGAKVADDYYNAAMVYQHGTTPAQARRAHELAMKAVELDPSYGAAKWLAAASLDRALMYEKKPQKYGTQYAKKDGAWVLWDVDPATTDDERGRWNVPPLAQAKARAEQMNAR